MNHGPRYRPAAARNRRSRATLPDSVEVVLGNQVYIDRTKLPPALVNRIARLAAFQNPEFYAAQAMRLPTFGKPRIISCAELFPKHVALPRGCLDDLLSLLGDVGIAAELRDERQQGRPLGTRFLGELTPEQDEAAAALLKHETGVLAATTAFGKTVVAAKMIARGIGIPWFLSIAGSFSINGWRGSRPFWTSRRTRSASSMAGRRSRPAIIDIALMQSLVRKGVVSDLVADYGHVVVDECHHLSAVGFEAIARAGQGPIRARTIRDGDAEGRPSPDHLHAMRPGSSSCRCQEAGGRSALRPQGRFPAHRVSASSKSVQMKSRQSRNFTQSSLRTRRGMI